MSTWHSSRASAYRPGIPEDGRVFHHFNDLPSEIRLKIWRFAIIDFPARVLSIQPSQSSIPALFQTCSEARREALETYTKRIIQAGKKEYHHYINHSKDIIYFNTSLGFRSIISNFPDYLVGVKHIALPFQQVMINTSFHSTHGILDLWGLIRENTPELKILYVVVGERAKGGRGKVRFVEMSGEEAYMYFCDEEQRRGLIEASRSFERVQSNGDLAGLKLGVCRESGGELEARVVVPRVGRWGALDWEMG